MNGAEFQKDPLNGRRDTMAKVLRSSSKVLSFSDTYTICTALALNNKFAFSERYMYQRHTQVAKIQRKDISK